MTVCGKPTNGGHKVAGAMLHCGMHLYWKVPGNDKARTQETVLCDACKEKAEERSVSILCKIQEGK